MDHPMVEGEYVDSVESKEVMEAYIFGIWMNNLYDETDQCIKGELWLNETRANVVEGAADVIARIKAQEIVEVSERNLVAVDDTPGEYNGQKYVETLTLMIPEHIATLPSGVIGACSNDEHGCGAGVNQQRNQGSNKAVNIESKPKEVSMMKGISAVMARLFRDKKESDKTGTDEKEVTALDLESRAQELVLQTFELLSDALKAIVPGFSYVKNFDPEKNLVYYEVQIILGDRYDGQASYKVYQRSYTEADNKVTLGDDEIEVIWGETYTPVASDPVVTETINQADKANVNDDATKEVVMAECTCGKHKNEKDGKEGVVEVAVEPVATVVEETKVEARSEAQASPVNTAPVDPQAWIQAVPDEFRSLLQSHAQAERQEKEALVNAAKEVGVEGLDVLSLPVLRSTCEAMGIRTSRNQGGFNNGFIPVTQTKEYTKPKVWGA
jgi:hypothetical protein